MEITNGFDNTGRLTLINGKNGDWFDPKSEAEFAKRARCFVDQYSAFSVPNTDGSGQPVHLNGNQTLDGTIADAGGLDNAFLAYRRFVAEKMGGHDMGLPGLEHYSPEALFFISYANGWCSMYNPDAQLDMVYNNELPLDKFRIAGTLASSVHFKETFRCVNKEPTCKMW